VNNFSAFVGSERKLEEAKEVWRSQGKAVIGVYVTRIYNSESGG
jgi:hypothetical protein